MPVMKSIKYNALNIAVRIEGEDLPEDARLIVNNETLVKPGEGFKLTAKLENLSTKAIKAIRLNTILTTAKLRQLRKPRILQAVLLQASALMCLLLTNLECTQLI